MTAVIIDALVVIVLAIFLVCGTLRGLLRSLAGLLVLIAALVGAGMAASSCSEPVTKYVAPLVEQKIVEKVQAELAEYEVGITLPELPEESALGDLMGRLGLDEAAWKPIAERVQKNVAETGAEIAEAVAEGLVHSVVYGVIFLLTFLILLILLKILLKVLDLVTMLPVIHGINALGGGILGLIEGSLALFLAVWIARKFGVSFESELFEGAHILRIFTANTPLGVLSFLH